MISTKQKNPSKWKLFEYKIDPREKKTKSIQICLEKYIKHFKYTFLSLKKINSNIFLNSNKIVISITLEVNAFWTSSH